MPRYRLRDYRGLDQRIWVLAAARAINTMGLSLVMAFMTIYLVVERGLPASIAGVIYLVANALQSVATGYAGELSDRLGRRGLMCTALTIRAGVIAGLGAEILADASLWVVAPTLVVSSTLRGLFEPTAYAMVADVTPAGDRVAAFGLQRMGTNLGWALGPALGGILAQVVSYGAIFFCAAPSLLIVAVLIARTEEPRSEGEREGVEVSLTKALREAAARPPMAVLLGCAFLAAMVHVQLFTTLSVYSTDSLALDKSEIGLVYTLNGVLVLLLQLPAIGFIERIGTARALILGSAIFALSFTAVGVASGIAGIAVAVSILTVGEIILAPAQQSIIADESSPGRMGRAYGLLGLLQMAGVAIGPIVGGAAFDLLRSDGVMMWLCLATLPIGLTLGYIAYGRLRRPTGETA